MKTPSALLSTLLGISFSTGALACSICRCGDPTFNSIGKEGISLPGLHGLQHEEPVWNVGVTRLFGK